ncbi:undecaprenyldiphospho-muramoylpentapeptide beta-N-acetylglucosaminyltransferase [Brevibacillus daliensis]|uniref:undecaprenyldiphospho-muramoylpentapeptide beta-N-acetylglucosaminyltransferase n=1 Tax=Brevibacillus daliensis TaxID=2892995 RepID=UPI001E4BFD79|nr:undecaprenyldiphospho-muramoylpentapeptide beta-N-acetylglucosaminyltransferase [Brevibacillus daliensis]
MRVVLTGGGTGGHIYPALAVAKEILRHEPQAAFLYIGTKRGLESIIVPKHNIPFQSVEISGFKRSLSLENFRTIMKFFRAVSDAKRMLKEFKPDVVIGTGGYVCGPVVYAATKLGIRTVIHEQNVEPGITNKFLSRYVNKVAVSFEDSLPYFPSAKTIVTGNPRATEVVSSNPEKGRSNLQIPAGKKIVLLVGGSRGARAINEATLAAIPQFSQYPDCHFVYVTGDVHYESIKERIDKQREKPTNFTVVPYVDQMPDLLSATHVIVNRAGASFLAEITALGIPAILIPSPYVTNNHQVKNARGLEKEGAAEVILESELNEAILMNKIDAILHQEGRWQKMREASLSLGMPEAATNLYRCLA